MAEDILTRAARLAEISKKRAVANAEPEQTKKIVQMFLPGFDIGAMPNHINRSSLFAPIARGRRRFHRQTVMVTRSDCVLEYTGEQLDEADCDLMMSLIWYAQRHSIGEWVPLHRAEILRKIGRDIGKAQYEWLHRRMRAMTESTLYIEARKPDGATRYKIGHAEAFHCISGFQYSDDDETYRYRLDPRWVTLFGRSEYALIDFDARLLIRRGQDMAKTLQRLIATSDETPQRYALDWLKEKMEYAGRMRDFRDALVRAVAELERIELVSKGRVEDSTRGKPQLVLWLPSV